MRYSRLPASKPKRNYGTWILLILLLGAGVYIYSATAAGSWLAEHVVTPVFSYLESGGKQTGINDLPALSSKPTSSSASASADSKVTESVDAEDQTYYLLQSGVFENEQNATDAAAAIKKRGGAGYIFKDNEKNKVILSAYKTENDAKSVKDSLLKTENITTYIFNIKLQGLNFSITASNGQAQALKEGIALPAECINKLMELSVKFDKGESIEDGIQQLKTNCISIRDQMNAVIKDDEKNQAIVQFKEYIALLCELINKLPDTPTIGNVETSSQIKYTVVWAVVNYSELMKKMV
jgi:hypothetical protein